VGNPETLVTLAMQDTGQRLKKTQGQIKNGKYRDTANIGNTRHSLEKTQGQIKNGQSRNTGNIGCTRHKTKVRENKRANKEWAIPRHWYYWVHKTQEKD
jgi:hypothetical protein